MVQNLVLPLVVDSEGSRLYISGEIDGTQQIVALAAGDGRLLRAYGKAGRFAVDPFHGRLYVDEKDSGLYVLDILTGEEKMQVPLPESQQTYVKDPAPQADPTTGQVLAFRDNSVYVIDPEQGTIVKTIPFDFPQGDDCRTLEGPLPIRNAIYDGTRRLLYLEYTSYSCIPWIFESVVSFDMHAGVQVAQGVAGDLSTVVTLDGYLYGSSWYRMGIGYRRVWRDGEPWFVSSGWDNSPKLVVDETRGRLYESSSEHGFRAFDLETMDLLFVLPSPVDGDLVGYDPGTDQLYFFQYHPVTDPLSYPERGRLAIWPASDMVPPAPKALQPAHPPTKHVHELVLSPDGSQAPTLFGLWGHEVIMEESCTLFGVEGGYLYLGLDGGKTWLQPQGGLEGGCPCISALAVSPNYATDQTMLVALIGNGIFRSTDGGRLWQPSCAGQDSIAVVDILLSPGFARDQTAFSRSRCEDTQGRCLYRSTDGGATWERLEVGLSMVTLSPDFEQDGVLMGLGWDHQVVISRDRGETWQPLGTGPEGVWFSGLSVAPLFDRWQVVFGFSGSDLYRSADGGRSWQEVLPVGGYAFSHYPKQIVYGPETEMGRLLFLVTTEPIYGRQDNFPTVTYEGALYRSIDGGMSWEEVELPADLVPTALAISPTYDQDGLIWLGTGDGRVISLEAAQLHGSP